jgi:hypothetical protein
MMGVCDCFILVLILDLTYAKFISLHLARLVKSGHCVAKIRKRNPSPDDVRGEVKRMTSIHVKTRLAVAIGSSHTLQFFGGGEVAKAAQNRTTFVEFKVDGL